MTLPPRAAVVDLGSNSVRLVIFEGRGRNPVAIFNEKAVLRLGRGLHQTGQLNEEGIAQALTVMNRYHTIARAMGAEPFEVLATAAVRDAANGPEFVAILQARMPDVPIRVLPGQQEAALSAAGVFCGIPDADGVLADIGGGSLELVRLAGRRTGEAVTLRLGVIRLAERANGDPAAARAIAEAELSQVPWLAEGTGRHLYAVGGAWRALARIHIARSGYPLNMIHHHTLGREDAWELTGEVAAASRRTLERIPGAPRRRLEDLPYAAIVLRRLLHATAARRVVFSASGLREGWYMGLLPEVMGAQDPILSAARDFARAYSRDLDLPEALVAWTDPLFAPAEAAEARRLRAAACWMSDIGSHDHPDYRAEQAFLRIVRAPGIGMDHAARAFLGLTLAVRYEAEPDAPFLSLAPALLDPEQVRRAVILGCALRLAYTLSAGTPGLLAATRLRLDGGLLLELTPGTGVFAGESVTRRLERLALALGLTASHVEVAPGG
jgi:exopolyphosphatase/guanosine-5'-triphosphate,3'-diphosphate pyrophosphatase